jgi:hypothetical protein
VVVLALVAGEGAVDPGADHLQKGVLGQVRVAGVVEGAGVGPRQADALVELADGEQPGVAGEWAGDGSMTSGVPKEPRTWGQA